jgi:hypothetical protein
VRNEGAEPSLEPLMVAATLTLVTLLCATLIGLTVYRWRRDKSFSIAWAIGSALLAILIFIATGVIYLYFGSLYPTSNSSRFEGSELVLRFGWDRLVFRQPAEAGVGVDFHIHLRVPSVNLTGPIQVELSAPASFQIRTDYACAKSEGIKKAGAACGPVTEKVFEVDWTITPKSTSSSELWISLPPQLRPDVLYGADWHAIFNPMPTGDAIYDTWRRKHKPVSLDASSPKLVYENYDIDLSRGRLGARTTVVNTLGVSDKVWTWLVLLGSVTTSALGSGWLVQFVAWVRKKMSG